MTCSRPRRSNGRALAGRADSDRHSIPGRAFHPRPGRNLRCPAPQRLQRLQQLPPAAGRRHSCPPAAAPTAAVLCPAILFGTVSPPRAASAPLSCTGCVGCACCMLSARPRQPKEAVDSYLQTKLGLTPAEVQQVYAQAGKPSGGSTPAATPAAAPPMSNPFGAPPAAAAPPPAAPPPAATTPDFSFGAGAAPPVRLLPSYQLRYTAVSPAAVTRPSGSAPAVF